MPVYEKLGDVHSRAITLGQIAGIHYRRGEYDEALRIYRDEELPVYEKLGDVHSLLVARANLAVVLIARARPEDGAEARALLSAALKDAKRLNLPEQQVLQELLDKAITKISPTA